MDGEASIEDTNAFEDVEGGLSASPASAFIWSPRLPHSPADRAPTLNVPDGSFKKFEHAKYWRRDATLGDQLKEEDFVSRDVDPRFKARTLPPC